MTLLDNFNELINSCFNSFSQRRIAERVKSMAIGLISCYGRHTVTGMLTGCGKQFVDWSAAYRIFSQNRINIEEMNRTILKEVASIQASSENIVAHMDDTLIRKKGKKIPGTGWRRDPLGPPFHTNFVWGQRYLQMSIAIADHDTNCQSRALPIDFIHCPPVTKLQRNATEEEVLEFKEKKKQARLNKQGSLRIKALRENLDETIAKDKQLIVSVDGSYTNGEVMKNLPGRTTLIGRIRKDTKLHKLPPENQDKKGRKNSYGEQIPTPEQIRQDENTKWEKATAWAAGKSHAFDVKIIKDLKWRAAGKNHIMQLIVIRPLSYRLSKGSKLLYRQPAYLICTDNHLDIEKLLQAYLWRWEIEVNLRDEKTILGCGQAQVRNDNAVKNLPAFTTAIYSLIHLASKKYNLERGVNILPKAKWDNVEKHSRLSTSELLNQIRCQIWSQNNKINFLDFVENQTKSKSLRINVNPSTSAMFYVRK